MPSQMHLSAEAQKARVRAGCRNALADLDRLLQADGNPKPEDWTPDG